VTSAAQLSRLDRAARPRRYRHPLRWQATYATRTMRYGGVIIALFLVWHLLDLTIGVANPDFDAGRPYHNVVVDFRVWWINVIYIVAIVLVGLHIQHGFASAAQSLGLKTGRRLNIAGTALAVIITAGFIAVPVGVMTGLVR
jgi:succinate dehydrogenase / fumarate reductase, cytochrome b subunit